MVALIFSLAAAVALMAFSSQLCSQIESRSWRSICKVSELSLCHDAGISLKCSDGQLVLFDQATYEAKPPVLTIRRNNGRILPAAPKAYGAYGKDPNCTEYISHRLSTGAAETQYGSCRGRCRCSLRRMSAPAPRRRSDLLRLCRRPTGPRRNRPAPSAA